MTADRELLATVAEGIGGDPDEPDGAWDVAELAVRDAGRWLAERLRAEADGADYHIGRAEAYRVCAGFIEHLSGVRKERTTCPTEGSQP